jgi:LmbE family N-acetylglucosaminyl deacetylase
VHAHPDDETLFTGAALALAADLGYQIRLVCLTGGEAPELAVPIAQASSARLAAAAQRRLPKLVAACADLGVTDIDATCGFIDAAGANHPLALHRAGIDAIADLVRRKLAEFDPAIVLTLDADGVTGHGDHIAAATAVRQAVAALPAATRPMVLAAAVPAEIVARAHSTLGDVTKDRVGSGRLVGTRAAITHTVACGACGDRKRAAMDRYRPGLGTAKLTNLIANWPGRDDTLLARAILDELGRAGLAETYVTAQPPRHQRAGR